MALKGEGLSRVEKQEVVDHEKSVPVVDEAEQRRKIQELAHGNEVARRQEEVLAGKLEEWLQLYPEAFEADAETQQAYADRLQRREQLINDRELMGVLWEYGVDNENIELDETGAYRIRVENHFTDKRLPLGYAYKGGSARALALRALKINPSETPRDLDVVRIVDTEPSEAVQYSNEGGHSADEQNALARPSATKCPS